MKKFIFPFLGSKNQKNLPRSPVVSRSCCMLGEVKTSAWVAIPGPPWPASQMPCLSCKIPMTLASTMKKPWVIRYQPCQPWITSSEMLGKGMNWTYLGFYHRKTRDFIKKNHGGFDEPIISLSIKLVSLVQIGSSKSWDDPWTIVQADQLINPTWEWSSQRSWWGWTQLIIIDPDSTGQRSIEITESKHSQPPQRK